MAETRDRRVRSSQPTEFNEYVVNKSVANLYVSDCTCTLRRDRGMHMMQPTIAMWCLHHHSLEVATLPQTTAAPSYRFLRPT